MPKYSDEHGYTGEPEGNMEAAAVGSDDATDESTDFTHAELDKLASLNDVKDYPTSGNKKEKYAALKAAGAV